MKCIFSHQWNGCTCTKCNKTRNSGHRFAPVTEGRKPKCTICGQDAIKPVLRSFGTERKGKNTYEYYAAGSAEEAKLFLSYCSVSQPLYYIQVETPEGLWGKDKEGLYLLELRPFQKEKGKAQCEGKRVSIPTMFSIQLAVKGISDNFICTVQCGSCNAEWQDGLRYKNKTVVKCPVCGKYNSVDTSDITVLG